MTSRMMTLLLAPFAFACVVASAAEPAQQYTPEIHGMLTSGRQPIASNVCLRQSDSQIRNCGYADASGRFLIQSAPVRRSPLLDDAAAAQPLTFWLETGNVLTPQKLSPIAAAADRNSAIELTCDMAQAGRGEPTFRSCETKVAKPLVMYVPRDDTPYRMAHPASPAN
jgi:hypothetical protein